MSSVDGSTASFRLRMPGAASRRPSRVPVDGAVHKDYYLGLDYVLLNLIIYSIIFIPLEKLYGRLRQGVFRDGWRVDLTYFFVSAMLVLGSGSTVFAKAHDQGVADGMETPDNTGFHVQNVVEGPGISQTLNGGRRGDLASGRGGENRVQPVTGNGANVEPD